MRKELIFQTKIDSSDFDKSVEKIKQKIQSVSMPVDVFKFQREMGDKLKTMGYGPTLTKPTQEAFNLATQKSRREMDQIIKDMSKNQEKLGHDLVNHQKTLERLKDTQKGMVEGSQDELRIREKIGRVSENQYKMEEEYRQRAEGLRIAADARTKMGGTGLDRLRDAYKLGGVKGLLGAAFESIGGVKALAAGSTVLGSVATIGTELAKLPMKIEEARGTAIQQTVGTDLSRIYEGKAPFEANWMKERGQAASVAEEKADKSRFYDTLRGVVQMSTMMVGLVTMFTGKGLAGKAAGAAITAGGAKWFAGDEMARTAALGLFSKEQQGKYETLLAAQQASDFRKTLEDLKQQSPVKKAELERFEKNYFRDLQAQRLMGLTNQQYYGEGGFLARGARAGFLPEQMIQMGQGILGAGGSARMGRESQFGLQMERMGLSNASQILGTLSGAIQTLDSNKKAVVSIISEAFKIGLDNTDFAEEQRRFTQAAANIISRTGATAETDQDRISKTLGMFLGERTNLGVQAAQTAYERYQERGAEMGGRRGALKLSMALQDTSLRKIPTDELTELLSMRPEQLKENNEVVQYYASKAGVSPEELIQKITGREGIRGRTRFLIPGMEQRSAGFSKTISDYMTKQGIGLPQLIEQQEKGQLPPEISQAMGGLQATMNIEEKGGLTTREARAAMGELITGKPSEYSKEAVEDKLRAVGGKIEDKYIAMGAMGADEARKQFDALIPSLQGAVKAVDEFTGQISGAAKSIDARTRERQAEMPSADPFNRMIYQPMMNIPTSIFPVNQTQGNKVSR